MNQVGRPPVEVDFDKNKTSLGAEIIFWNWLALASIRPRRMFRLGKRRQLYSCFVKEIGLKKIGLNGFLMTA